MDPRNEMNKLYRKSSLLLALVGVLLISASWAQSPAQSPQTGAATATAPQNPQPAPDKKKAAADAAAQEQEISPKEAEELFHDVDQIMQFASKETGLPIKKEVQRRLVSRDEVVGVCSKRTWPRTRTRNACSAPNSC